LTKHGLSEYRKGGNLADLFEPLWRLFVTVCSDPDAGQFVFILDALDECDVLHSVLRREIDKVDNRTYLWVSLIFPELQDNAVCEESELLQIFKTLPKTVEEAYEAILSRSTNVERARKLLSIIMAATRGLTLKELKIAFSINRNGNYGKLDEVPKMHSSRLADMPIGPIEASFLESIRQLCGLFIRTTGSRVYLIHQTAQEFRLESQYLSGTDQSNWRHSFRTADSHLVLARSCIWYLMLPKYDEQCLILSKGKWKPSGRTFTEFTFQNPFVEYAGTHWTTHFNASNATDTDELSAAATMLCSTETHRFRTWYKIYWSAFYRSIPSTYTNLVVAASFDLVQVIQILLLRGEDACQVDDDGDTALSSAAIHRRERAAKKLIEFNAPINVKAKDGNNPLHSAAAWGSKVVLELLISHGADIECRNNEDRTPLHRAAQFGHADLVKALIKAGANVNALDTKNRSPLHLAALTGHGSRRMTEGVPPLQSKRAIEDLIRNGADRELIDHEGMKAMQLARQDEMEYLFGRLGLHK
jgi:hypothetical protein